MNLFVLLENLFVLKNEDVDEVRKRTFLSLIIIIVIPTTVIYAISYFIAGNILEGFIILGVTITFVLNLFALKYMKNVANVYRADIAILLSFLCYGLAIGAAHGYWFLWYYLFPLSVFYMLEKKEGLIWIGISVLMSAFFLLAPVFHEYDLGLSIRYLVTYSIVSMLSLGLESSRSRYYQEMMYEKNRLDDVNRRLGEKMNILMMEKELQQSEDRYRSLVENTLDGYFIYDIPSLQYLFVNQSACDIFGYTLKEGLELTVMDVISPVEHERVKKSIQGLIEGQTSSSQRQIYNAVHKNGTNIRVEISTSLVTFKGKPAVQGAVRDITEQERLELQLQQSKKMEAIGLLAGGVAHDLNNVLSGIVSYPNLLLMDLAEDSPLRKPIETIHSSGQKAAEIVQDLLTLARRGVTNMDIININDVVLDYLRSPEFEKLRSYHATVTVETDLDEHLENIEGSSTQLLKMIMNLVSNAAEAQPTGGHIEISTHNQYVETSMQAYEEIKQGEYAVLEISDRGLGIAVNDLDRIFEPFYTKKVMGRSGTGLGMAVVWGTTHDHDGYIDIHSTEGVGTNFSLYFPITREKDIGEKDFIPVEEYLGAAEKVLVVDDVSEQREIAATMLSKLNYDVATVSSGEEAVAYVQDSSVDLLILDMIMAPGIDGLETYQRIKALVPDQKAIIASGYSETHRVKEAIKLGAGQYIRKPYTIEKIGIAVRDELSR